MIRTFPALAALTLASAATLAACGSAPPAPPNAAQAPTSAPPFMYFSSQRSPAAIARCLTSHVDGLHKSVADGATELAIGRADDYAWLITLMPADAGSVVKVQKSPNDDGPVPEPQMRFYIARCTTS